jgi:hypothetical protein
MKTRFKTAKVIREFKISAFGYDLIVPIGATVTNATAMGNDDAYRFWLDYQSQAKALTGHPDSMLAHDLGHYGVNVPAEFCEPYKP